VQPHPRIPARPRRIAPAPVHPKARALRQQKQKARARQVNKSKTPRASARGVFFRNDPSARDRRWFLGEFVRKEINQASQNDPDSNLPVPLSTLRRFLSARRIFELARIWKFVPLLLNPACLVGFLFHCCKEKADSFFHVRLQTNKFHTDSQLDLKKLSY
jgi:hypothetical protein